MQKIVAFTLTVPRAFFFERLGEQTTCNFLWMCVRGVNLKIYIWKDFVRALPRTGMDSSQHGSALKAGRPKLPCVARTGYPLVEEVGRDFVRAGAPIVVIPPRRMLPP